MKLIELSLAAFLFVATSYLIISNYTYNINRARSHNVKTKIINAVNYTQKKSLVDDKEYNIRFNLDNSQIDYINNTLKLDDVFLYECKNSSNNFTRTMTKKNNLDKGFTIIIKDKKSKKIYDTITYNTTNGLNLAVLNHEG